MSTATQPKTDWNQPQKVDRLTMAFGGDTQRLLPARDEIPREFWMMNDNTKWHKAQSRWFYAGVKKDWFKPKAGIDPEIAFGHLGTIQGSFEPKHEHKVAAVAWLMSLWFEDVTIPEMTSEGRKKAFGI